MKKFKLISVLLGLIMCFSCKHTQMIQVNYGTYSRVSIIRRIVTSKEVITKDTLLWNYEVIENEVLNVAWDTTFLCSRKLDLDIIVNDTIHFNYAFESSRRNVLLLENLTSSRGLHFRVAVLKLKNERMLDKKNRKLK